MMTKNNAGKVILSSKFIDDIKVIIDQGRSSAYSAVDHVMIITYWNIGRRIVEEEQQGQIRAEYGKKILPLLANELASQYGSGYSQRYLAYF